MFPLFLACPSRGIPFPVTPPDPWEVFRQDTLQPALEWSVVGTLALLAVAVVGALMLGLFLSLPDRDRSACATLPLMLSFGAFVLIQLGAPGGNWWRSTGLVHDVVLLAAAVLAGLGLLVLGRAPVRTATTRVGSTSRSTRANEPLPD